MQASIQALRAPQLRSNRFVSGTIAPFRPKIWPRCCLSASHRALRRCNRGKCLIFATHIGWSGVGQYFHKHDASLSYLAGAGLLIGGCQYCARKYTITGTPQRAACHTPDPLVLCIALVALDQNAVWFLLLSLLLPIETDIFLSAPA